MSAEGSQRLACNGLPTRLLPGTLELGAEERARPLEALRGAHTEEVAFLKSRTEAGDGVGDITLFQSGTAQRVTVV